MFYRKRCSSVTKSFLTLCDPMDCSMPGFPVLHYSPGVCSNSCLLSQWWHPTISYSVTHFSCSQSFPASKSSNEVAFCIRWPKYWSFSFSISPSSEYSGLVSFRIDWFDLLAVRVNQKSLFHHHSLKASVFQCSPFFMVQLSHPYMTTGKTDIHKE